MKDSSVIVVQIFDQKKFKRKDQGFLGVINVKVSQVLDLDLGGEGASFIDKGDRGRDSSERASRAMPPCHEGDNRADI